MYTIFSAVQRQQRKSDVMTYFGLATCSAVYYCAGFSYVCICKMYYMYMYMKNIMDARYLSTSLVTADKQTKPLKSITLAFRT
jgi:hypothetical protein